MKVEHERVCGDPDITVQVLSFEDTWDHFEVQAPFGRVRIKLNDDRNALLISAHGQIYVLPVVSNVIEVGAAK